MDLMSKNNKGTASLLVILIIVMAGYFIYKAIPPEFFKKFTPKSPSTTSEEGDFPKSTKLLKEIQGSLGGNPKEWKDGVITGIEMAPDLVQVCVDYPESENGGPTCDIFEYYTNNRTGNWELLGRFGSGQEGFGVPFCENWEKLKVAKGMSCSRWDDSASRYVDSEVKF